MTVCLVLIPRAGDRVYEQFLLVMVLVVETSQTSGPLMVRVRRARVTPRVASRGATPPFDHTRCSPAMHKSCVCVNFIAEHTKAKEDATKAKEDWKYVAMVLDRLFLWIFTMAVVVGTAGIILQAPSLYDDRIPIDKELSDIGLQTGSNRNERVRTERTRATC